MQFRRLVPAWLFVLTEIIAESGASAALCLVHEMTRRKMVAGPELPEALLGNYSGVPHIPAFALATEDTRMLARLAR